MNEMHDKQYEDAWENEEYGMDEKYVQKANPEQEKKLDEKLGLQVISIRLQKDLIETLKNMARENGLGYQPYIRQILTKHVKGKCGQDFLEDHLNNF